MAGPAIARTAGPDKGSSPGGLDRHPSARHASHTGHSDRSRLKVFDLPRVRQCAGRTRRPFCGRSARLERTCHQADIVWSGMAGTCRPEWDLR